MQGCFTSSGAILRQAGLCHVQQGCFKVNTARGGRLPMYILCQLPAENCNLMQSACHSGRRKQPCMLACMVFMAEAVAGFGAWFMVVMLLSSFDRCRNLDCMQDDSKLNAGLRAAINTSERSHSCCITQATEVCAKHGTKLCCLLSAAGKELEFICIQTCRLTDRAT